MTREKNLKIKQSIISTLKRRKSQTCHVFKVKIDYSKLNAKQKEQLKMVFVEAKWIYNMLLSKSETESLFEMSIAHFSTLKEVNHYDKDKKEVTSPLKYISSQMKQSILRSMQSSIKTLSSLKKKGMPVGKLKYLSEYRSINLQQYGITYSIVGKNKVKIQKLGTFKVNGLKQIQSIEGIEIANAKLINSASGYYIAITTFCPKKIEAKDKALLGIDLGCKTTVTCSDGTTFDCKVEETERLKRLQRKLQDKKKGSNSYMKVKLMLKKEHEHIANKRADKANKIVASLKRYKIVMQDEQISSWKDDASGTGRAKTIQHSCLGRIKSKLMQLEDTVVLDKWLPTTKICCNCGTIVEMTMKDRTFHCPKCGLSEDRDLHAAKNMLRMYNILAQHFDGAKHQIVGVGCTDFKRLRKDTRQKIVSALSKVEDTTL